MSIRILLADDHGIIRSALRAILEREQGMEVVGEAEDGRKALELARELVPDVILMDITMPGLNGIDATRKIISEFPKIKVIALTIHAGSHFITEMFKAVASGYLLKDCLVDELVGAIRTVHAGGMYTSPEIAGILVDDYVHTLSNGHGSSKPTLTSREREVLQLIAEGKTTKQIALILHVSPKTIEANRLKIMKKLELDSIAELTKYAIREGLICLES